MFFLCSKFFVMVLMTVSENCSDISGCTLSLYSLMIFCRGECVFLPEMWVVIGCGVDVCGAFVVGTVTGISVVIIVEDGVSVKTCVGLLGRVVDKISVGVS